MLAFREALRLLEHSEQMRLYGLLGLSSLAAVVQTLAILSVMPFIALLANPDLLHSSELMSRAYVITGASSYAAFLTIFGAVGIVVLTIGNLFLALEQWLAHRFLCRLEHRLGQLVIRKLLSQPYEQHVRQHSARLSDVVLTQVSRVVDGVIGASLATVSNLALTAFIVLMLLAVSLKSTLVTLIALLVAYLGIFLLLRRRIAAHGAELTSLSGTIAIHVREILEGIREIKVRLAEDFFAGRFGSTSQQLSKLVVRYGVLGFLPGLILETLIFVGLVGIALYFVVTTRNAGVSLTYIALYGIAIYRLVPALKGVFDGIAEVQHNGDAVRIVGEHCGRAEETVAQVAIDAPVVAIACDGVSYDYDSGRGGVRDISLSIPAGTSLCLFGPSGSGKTTLVNILAGLLQPHSGQVLCDEIPLAPVTRDSWRALVGYCPQSVFLFDDTIASNIAFGVALEDIDRDRITAVARMANIFEFVDTELERGFDTLIGEAGKTLSGGQRQRLGIARALYHDPAVLLLDESFSGLDAAAKENILDNLFALPGKTIVFSSHEPGIAARCDSVAMMRSGRLVSCDSYHALVRELAIETD